MATGYIPLSPLSASPNSSNPPGLAWENDRPYLAFDDSTAEYVYWTFICPGNYSSSPVLRIFYSMDTATANEIVVSCGVMAVSDGESQNMHSDSYDTTNTSSAITVPGTANYPDQFTLSLTNDDGLAANDYISLQFFRHAASGGDDATGDMHLWGINFEYTTT